MTTYVHWLFQVPRAAQEAANSIVLRPVLRQKRGGRLRECPRCAVIGKGLGIS